jgi:hypothetical protein
MMDAEDARNTSRLAVAVGVVAAGSAVCLATYFVVRGPFGTLNDIGNATTGVLSAALAWRLRRHVAGRAGDVALGAALAGAAITVTGSALVVSGSTGFFFAGLVSSVGFAGIGVWLVVLNRRSAAAATWSSRLRALGVIAGGLMLLGVATVPGVLLGLDDMETAPGWIWIGQLGWLGTFVVYPAWAISMGVVETRRARRTLPSSEPSGSNEEGLGSSAATSIAPGALEMEP